MPGLYVLPSSWLLDASPEDVWEAVAGPEMDWPRWWPGCTRQDVSPAAAPSGDRAAVLLSSTVRLQFRAALGYRLSITLRPTAVDHPVSIDFDAAGDLAGSGQIRLTPLAADGGTEPVQTRMDISWRVRPTRPWMRLLTPVARPVLTAAHALLMHRGEKGLQRLLRRAAGGTRQSAPAQALQATRRGRPNRVSTPVE